MLKDIETIINTQDDIRVAVSNWDEGGAWISLMSGSWSSNVAMTRDEALMLLDGLKAVLQAEVEA